MTESESKTTKKTDMSTGTNQDELPKRLEDMHVDDVKYYLQLAHDLTMKSYSKDGYKQSIETLKKEAQNIQKVLKICSQRNDPATSRSLADSEFYTTSARHFSLFVRTINPDFIDNEFLQRCANMAKEANMHAIKINFDLLLTDQERINSIGKSDIQNYDTQMRKTQEEFKTHAEYINKDKSLCAEYYYQYGRYLTQKSKQTRDHDERKSLLNQAREELKKSLVLRREQQKQSSESTVSNTSVADTVYSLLEMGNAYKNFPVKNDKEAVKYFNEAINLTQDNLGEHELTAHCHKNLGDLFLTNKKFEEARKEYNVAKKMLENLGLRDTIRYVSVLKNLALTQNGKAQKAEILKTACDIAKKLGDSHEARVYKGKLYVSLAEIQTGREKHETAQEALKFRDVLHSKDVEKMEKM